MPKMDEFYRRREMLNEQLEKGQITPGAYHVKHAKLRKELLGVVER